METLTTLSVDERLLQEANAGYIRSVRTSDASWFDENLGAEFFNGNGDGSVSSRAEFLVEVARPLALRDFDCRDVRVRILGDTAIIQGRTVYRKPDGSPGEGRYTDIWARRGGRWLCIAADVIRG
jgi:hypothetical protein